MSAYSMTISLNVLNHLGLNLYSNTPAVLSEAVANAWDADAETVAIKIDANKKKITITDDGVGMSRDDINEKYLTVGYERRKQKGEAKTPAFGRPVMGRKGIGKLSLFSIASTIEVWSVKDGKKSGCRLELEKIRQAIKKGEGQYRPTPVSASKVRISKGTRITLTNLRKQLHKTGDALRRRLARRFSVIGDAHRFSVTVDGTPITVADRDYFHRLQYLWPIGKDAKRYTALATNVEKTKKRPGLLSKKPRYAVSGWIGTAKDVGALKDGTDSINNIVVLVRGKVAQEDILEECGITGMVTKYIIGELNADFLDLDQKDDIATSSRQRIVEDDSRYIALKDFVTSELQKIRYDWNTWRSEAGTSRALQIPAIRDWFDDLSKDAQRRAASLFGKINQLTLDSEEQRRALLKHGVLAFESFRQKQNLDAIDRLSPENLEALTGAFADLDDIEATLYHQIVRERVQVIKVLREKVEDNALEKVVQKHLFKHLWLLDPSWERATGTAHMEQTVAKEFGAIDASLTKEEKKGRLDIKYTTTSGKHVIVELKRASVVVSTWDILKQTSKYRNALRKILNESGKEREPIEVVCVVGRQLKDWAEEQGRAESIDALKAKDTRTVMYQELIENAYKAYHEFVEKSEQAGRVSRLIQSIEEDDFLPE